MTKLMWPSDDKIDMDDTLAPHVDMSVSYDQHVGTRS